MIKIYGIKNCDTVKKAVSWLKDNDVAYHFHDYKKEGVDVAQLTKFVHKFGWEKVLNRKGTTWRKLSDEEKESVVDEASAMKVMMGNTSMIKRPLVDLGGDQLLGFDESEYGQMVMKRKK